MWLTCLKDVIAFVKEQHLNNIGFTPATNFHTCVNSYTGFPAFTRPEAAQLNRMLAEATRICEQEGTDIYQVCIDVYQEISASRLEALSLGLDAPFEPPFYQGDSSLSFTSSFKKKPARKPRQAVS
jgi:hypothetical protein